MTCWWVSCQPGVGLGCNWQRIHTSKSSWVWGKVTSDQAVFLVSSAEYSQKRGITNSHQLESPVLKKITRLVVLWSTKVGSEKERKRIFNLLSPLLLAPQHKGQVVDATCSGSEPAGHWGGGPLALHLSAPIRSRPATQQAARAVTAPHHLGGVGGFGSQAPPPPRRIILIPSLCTTPHETNGPT